MIITSLMKDGPVPSSTYDLLKQAPRTLRDFGRPFPWTRRPAPEVSRRAFAFEHPARDLNPDVLSPSDMKALQEALTVVKALGFKQVRKLTHDDPAYLDAWEDNGPENSRYPMSYTLLYESPSEQKAMDLAFFSQHL